MSRIKCSLCRRSFRTRAEISIVDDVTTLFVDERQPLSGTLEGLRLYCITWELYGRSLCRYIMLVCHDCADQMF